LRQAFVPMLGPSPRVPSVRLSRTRQMFRMRGGAQDLFACALGSPATLLDIYFWNPVIRCH
jgi:hypothetical protein